MSQRRNIASRTLFWCALILGAAGSYNGVLAQSGIDTHDMERIGHSDYRGGPRTNQLLYSRAIASFFTLATTRAAPLIP